MAFDVLGERVYENDLLADGRFVADGKRRWREELVCCLGGEEASFDKEINLTLEELLGTRYIYDFDDETRQELYYMVEKDENGKIIVDTQNKRIKFIDKESGKFLFKKYL